MPYSDYTYNSHNPIRRFSHKRRFNQLCKLVSRYTRPGMNVLDFGCADGHLISLLSANCDNGCNYIGYDPYPDSESDPSVTIYDNFDDIKSTNTSFDVITCLEVLEHFNPNMQRKLIGQVKSILSPGGTLIISVPIESGLPGVFKGIIRKLTDKRLRPKYTWNNLWRTLISRPINQYRTGDGYLDHIGFYFKDLRKLLEDDFNIQSVTYSPFPFFGAALNSQITCILKPKQ